MQGSYTSTAGYLSGTDAWRDNVANYGIEGAVSVVTDYLDMNLRREHSADERKHCRELFAAMYVATGNKTDVSKLVYPHAIKIAAERLEKSYYRTSYNLNSECAQGIERLISQSCYTASHYNLELAAMLAVQYYGFPRVCMVLAFNYQSQESDARFGADNRQWANSFILPENAFADTWLKAHPTLIDAFCNQIRKLYQNLDAGRFALPGNEESGEFVIEYEIKQAITTSDDGNGFSTGYAIGHNPGATISQWACWQFAVREGERHYNHGAYCADEQTAIDSYIARVFVALN